MTKAQTSNQTLSRDEAMQTMKRLREAQSYSLNDLAKLLNKAYGRKADRQDVWKAENNPSPSYDLLRRDALQLLDGRAWRVERSVTFEAEMP